METGARCGVVASDRKGREGASPSSTQGCVDIARVRSVPKFTVLGARPPPPFPGPPTPTDGAHPDGVREVGAEPWPLEYERAPEAQERLMGGGVAGKAFACGPVNALASKFVPLGLAPFLWLPPMWGPTRCFCV